MLRSDLSNSLDGINNNTYELLFIDNMVNERLAKNDREFMMAAVQQFTKLNDEDIDYVVEHSNNIFLRNGMIFEINKNSKKYRFTLLDYFLEDRKEELRSDDRLGKCTEKSISLALGSDEGSKVMVGYLDNSVDKILHAVFLECNYDKEYVFDYSMNLVMEKKQYLELMDYIVINEIDSKNVKNDIDFIKKIDHFSIKFYFCFRDEMMNDLEKNKKVLKLEG